MWFAEGTRNEGRHEVGTVPVVAAERRIQYHTWCGLRKKTSLGHVIKMGFGYAVGSRTLFRCDKWHAINQYI